MIKINLWSYTIY